jgi:hypothetical protein
MPSHRGARDLKGRGPRPDACRQTRHGVTHLLELRVGYGLNTVPQTANVAFCGKCDGCATPGDTSPFPRNWTTMLIALTSKQIRSAPRLSKTVTGPAPTGGEAA